MGDDHGMMADAPEAALLGRDETTDRSSLEAIEASWLSIWVARS